MRIQRPVGCGLQRFGERREVQSGLARFARRGQMFQKHRRRQAGRDRIRIRWRIRSAGCLPDRWRYICLVKNTIERRADIRRVHRQHGLKVGERVVACEIHPPSDQLAYYRDLLVLFTVRMPRGHLTQELRVATTEMDRLVELDTATAAWRVAHVDAA